MDHLYGVTSAFRVGLGGLADWLYGCAHRRTTFPITLRAGVGVDRNHSTQDETYIACLECGRHLAYDWTAMRIARRSATRVPRQLALGAANRKSQ